jgi:hypothetical protein
MRLTVSWAGVTLAAGPCRITVFLFPSLFLALLSL